MSSGFLGRGMGPNALGGGAGGATPWYLAGGAPMPIAAYQPKGAASLAASYVNLANPGVYDAAPGVAPTLGASGWICNGNAWLDTGIVPLYGWSMIVRFTDQSGVDRFAGVYDTNKNFYCSPCYGATYRAYGHGAYLNAGAAIIDGVMAIAGCLAYLDGVPDGTILDFAWSTTYSIYLCGSNGTYSSRLIGTIVAVAIYDTSANHAIWVPAVSAAMAAL